MVNTKIYKVENVVASISLKVQIPLNKLKKLPNTKYNPEQFPGLVFRFPDMHFLYCFPVHCLWLSGV